MSNGPRDSSSSRIFQTSQSILPTASSSRPFLNLSNPMGRTYQGYVQVDQSLVEEEDKNPNGSEEDLESGLGGHTRGQNSRRAKAKAKADGKRRVSWRPGATEMSNLHPNIHREDKIYENGSSDDEVPQSFMIEATSKTPIKATLNTPPIRTSPHASPSAALNSTPKRVHISLPAVPLNPVPPTKSVPARTSDQIFETPLERMTQWSSSGPTDHSVQDRPPKPMRELDAYERALWNWVNVYNLDAFLQEIYYYYEGKGIYSIALARGLNLLTVGFVIGFSTFLLGCVDYSRIRPEGITRLSDIVVHRCVARFSGFTLLFFLLFTAFYVWQIVSFAMDVVRLVDMYNFYTHLLHIPDEDIQTISWPEIVRRIGAIREENPNTALSSAKRTAGTPATAKLDAHDIANRIMRQENYLIALFNKELLDLHVPIPAPLKGFLQADEWEGKEGGKGTMLTRTLEWNLRFCLMEYLFDARGRVRKVFLKSRNRAALIDGLRRRFVFMGILNAIFAPFIVLYLLMYSFFRYFEEYRKNPSSIGGRQYTPFAQWKFREFNELPHVFVRRLDESHPAASMYIGQFPNEKMTLVMRFVAFIAGSFAAVLVLTSVIDPELFIHFEISPGRTTIFYITVFGAVLAVARGMIPDENRVFDPDLLMMEVITHTHYMPVSWKGQLHSKRVHQEFGELFAMKIVIFAQELLSVLLTPFVLWHSLPTCAPAIIDFFRDFTVHVDGRGYVCSFAEFNFERHGNVKFGAPNQIQDQRMISNEGKMEKSFLNFKAANPDWNPLDPSGSTYLNRMADFTSTHPRHLPSYGRRRVPGVVTFEAMGTGSDMSGERKQDMSLVDRTTTYAYDRVLRQSQHLATTRQRRVQPPQQQQLYGSSGSGTGTGSVLVAGTGTGSMLLAPVGMMASSVYQSGAGMVMAQTAVLGDSQGSVVPTPQALSSRQDDVSSEEELAPDGVVGSGLGESYVDGGKRSKPSQQQGGEDEEEELEDGGVLGLLAQIYGGRGGLPA